MKLYKAQSMRLKAIVILLLSLMLFIGFANKIFAQGREKPLFYVADRNTQFGRSLPPYTIIVQQDSMLAWYIETEAFYTNTLATITKYAYPWYVDGNFTVTGITTLTDSLLMPTSKNIEMGLPGTTRSGVIKLYDNKGPVNSTTIDAGQIYVNDYNGNSFKTILSTSGVTNQQYISGDYRAISTLSSVGLNLGSDTYTPTNEVYLNMYSKANDLTFEVAGENGDIRTSGNLTVDSTSNFNDKVIIEDSLRVKKTSMFWGNMTIGGQANTIKVYNVKLYGAVGDGLTNDVTAIQSAATALNSYGGGILYFPQGTYIVDTIIKIGSNTTVMGDGWTSIVKLADGTGQPNYGETHTFTNNNSSTGNENITFKNIAINCNVANQNWDSDDIGGSAIHLNHAKNSQIINVRIDSVWRSGVHFENDSGLLISHCRISYTGSGGVLCGQITTWVRDIKGVTITKCYIDKAMSALGRPGASKSLIALADNIRGAIVTGNYLDNSDSYGVHILTHSGTGQYIHNIIVEKNEITNIASGGVFISAPTSEMSCISVQDNIFEKCLRGVYASGSTALLNGLNICGNIIRETSSTGTGIFIANDNIINCNISDNIIRNVTTRGYYGIRIAANNNGVVIGNNVIYNCDKSGILFETTAGNCVVSGNVINTNDEYAISENSGVTTGNYYISNIMTSNGSGDINRVGLSRYEVGEDNTSILGNTVIGNASSDVHEVNGNITFNDTVFFDGNIGNRTLHPDTLFGDAVRINGMLSYVINTDVADDGTIVFPISTYSCWGTINVDSSGVCLVSMRVRWDADGTPTIIESNGKSYIFTDTADTDGKVDFFDNGLGPAFRNRLGYSTKASIVAWYPE